VTGYGDKSVIGGASLFLSKGKMMTKTINDKKSIAAPQSVRSTKVSVRVGQEKVPRLPHERDESSDNQASEKRKIIQQASADMKRGLEDTSRGEESHKVYQKLK
jgi:hypothetical protein